MEKKYPSIKLTKESWEKILPIVEEWGCEIHNQYYCEDETRIVSNYGNPSDDELIIGTTFNENIGGRRYLVDTEDEFLSAIAKLIGKSYNPSSKNQTKKESIILMNKNKVLTLKFNL